MSGAGDSPRWDRRSALIALKSLRQGTPGMASASALSVGRGELFAAAEEELEELEVTGGSSVRWIMGSYGQGKTNSFARLISIAHSRNWVTSFVQISGAGQGTELCRFQEVYAAIVRNLLCREMVAEADGDVLPGHKPGWEWLLNRWYDGLLRQAGAVGGEVPTLKTRDVIAQTMTTLDRRWGIRGPFANALRSYLIARLDSDVEWQGVVQGWFRGEDVHSIGGTTRKRMKESGIPQKLDARNVKDLLRCFSAFVRSRGHGGLMILLDEVENVMSSTPEKRKAGYTILRELIDNVDEVHGNTCLSLYCAGTPDLFQSKNGILEYEALAARALPPTPGASRNPRSTLVDLADYPLGDTDLDHLLDKILAVAAAAGRLPDEAFDKANITNSGEVPRAGAPGFSVRQWIRAVVDIIDRQGRGVTPHE